MALEVHKEKRRDAQKAYRERQKLQFPTVNPNAGTGPASIPIDPALQSRPASIPIDPALQSRPASIPIDPALQSRPASTIRPVPTANTSSEPPARPLDFVTGVRGIQVPESATVIEWPGGLRTVAPTLEKDGVNVLRADEAYVRHVASFPQAVPGSAYIDFLDISSYKQPFDLVVDIRKSLSLGRPVVVRNFEDNSSFELSQDGLLRSLGISPNMLIDMHGLFASILSISFLMYSSDAEKRVADFSHPHVRGTISQLLDGINDPTQCRFALDMPLTHRAMPPSIRYADLFSFS